MKNPTKKQFQVVIDRLTAVLPFAEKEEQLDMGEFVVICPDEKHECGTVHCVGGWYKAYDYLVDKIKPPTGDYVGFSGGATKMAKDLGFNWGELESWAKGNPDIWGNRRGEYLFSSEGAYDGAKNLAEVVEWFKGVQSRLPTRRVKK